MVQTGAQRLHHLGRRRRISQSDREVTQPALVADAPDRRAAQPLLELRLAPGEELDHRRAVEAVTHLEVRLRARLREAVPRADELAVVAAVDPVADQRPQLLRNGALVLDRQIGDAAAGVELVRGDDRLRRADVDAPLARAAVSPRRRVIIYRYGERQIGVNLAKEEPGAGPVEEQRVLAAPADAGAHRKLDFHHGPRIGEHAVAEGADLGLDALAELLQPVAQHLVIVPAARVPGDVGALVGRGELIVADAVIHAAGYDAQGARLELRRTRPERAVPRHILHLAM